jgi:hypothetical protein
MPFAGVAQGAIWRLGTATERLASIHPLEFQI